MAIMNRGGYYNTRTFTVAYLTNNYSTYAAGRGIARKIKDFTNIVYEFYFMNDEDFDEIWTMVNKNGKRNMQHKDYGASRRSPGVALVRSSSVLSLSLAYIADFRALANTILTALGAANILHIS